MAQGKMADAHLYGLLFAGAVAAFCARTLIGNALGATSQLLAPIGDATCGWSWLLVRALFRRPGAQRHYWPLAVVIAMVFVGAALRFGDEASIPLLRVADNAEGLISSTLLLLAMIEPLRNSGDAMPQAEKRFRIGFSVCYATVLAVAVLWIDGAPADSVTARLGGTVKAICAMAALGGMAFAIWYRAGHPIPEAIRIKRRIAATEDAGLSERIIQLIHGKGAFAEPDLKVADLARRVGVAEYKVTQCITGPLGFRNFNHMANHFRLSEAKRRLSDPRFDHLPVLTIALDCGFGSIGPFNRTFKADTGTTPTQYRAAR
jgi:AraC-like DNA-binding protein